MSYTVLLCFLPGNSHLSQVIPKVPLSTEMNLPWLVYCNPCDSVVTRVWRIINRKQCEALSDVGKFSWSFFCKAEPQKTSSYNNIYYFFKYCNQQKELEKFKQHDTGEFKNKKHNQNEKIKTDQCSLVSGSVLAKHPQNSYISRKILNSEQYDSDLLNGLNEVLIENSKRGNGLRRCC